MATLVSLPVLTATIRRAIDSWPVDRSRIEKAGALIVLGHIEQGVHDTYIVRSQTTAAVAYTVTPSSCSCVDAARRPTRWCKHAFAVRILVAAELAQQAQTEQARRSRDSADRVAVAIAAAHRRAA